MEVEIWTDGASKHNPGPGGWGAWLRYGDHVKEIYGGELDTTNNQMELMAVIQALSLLKRPCHIVLHTDSKYVQQGITVWVKGWVVKGWKTTGNKPVKNVDLWKRLLEVSSRHKIDWRWVKGHDGVEGNERADFLANKGVDAALGKIPPQLT